MDQTRRGRPFRGDLAWTWNWTRTWTPALRLNCRGGLPRASPRAGPRVLRLREPGRLHILRARHRPPRGDRAAPPASLPRRAALLAESIAAVLQDSPGEVSLIGHSSGGLDARLLLTPGVSLPTSADVERCARSVRAVVTIAAPHHGTPLAHLFNSMLGQQILRVLSLTTIYTLRTGRLPISVALP